MPDRDLDCLSVLLFFMSGSPINSTEEPLLNKNRGGNIWNIDGPVRFSLIRLTSQCALVMDGLGAASSFDAKIYEAEWRKGYNQVTHNKKLNILYFDGHVKTENPNIVPLYWQASGRWVPFWTGMDHTY